MYMNTEDIREFCINVQNTEMFLLNSEGRTPLVTGLSHQLSIKGNRDLILTPKKQS